MGRGGTTADGTAGAGAELVPVLDPRAPVRAGAVVVDVQPRARVRAGNLPHAATAVLLRDGAGRVAVHRRTTTKDVYPGAHDAVAGGVVCAGEDPDAAAARELAEELGVGAGVLLTPLRPVLRRWYRDDVTHYLAFAYEAWVAPGTELRAQPSEVAEVWWEPAVRVRERLADPGWAFVPDTRALLAAWPDWWNDPGVPDDR
ncbi:NUDIX domain-containing protein [Kineococcus gynurae]|uniref:NUDIX domain-containing protein n=1 Tax=Kineococcus gynurae TaxID=452979 RepID=A0ABV5LQW9_9ACTN